MKRTSLPLQRREFITLLGGAAACTARGASAAAGHAGDRHLLSEYDAADAVHLLGAFRQGLSELGFVEGQNVAIEYRWAQVCRLTGCQHWRPILCAVKSVVIVATDSAGDAGSCKAATNRIPIVFIIGNDPVRSGVVTSLNRAGG